MSEVLFYHNSVVYVHYIYLTSRFQVAVSGFPIHHLKCGYGHVSILSKIALFPDNEELSQFGHVVFLCKSSAVLDVSDFLIVDF